MLTCDDYLTPGSLEGAFDDDGVATADAIVSSLARPTRCLGRARAARATFMFQC